MSYEYLFQERLDFSLGRRKENDLSIIRRMVIGCVDVQKTTVAQDRTGVDYIATLRGGASIRIDAKARETRPGGIRKHWRQGEEIALEIWSVIPTPTIKGKAGWTLTESKEVDLILFTFDPCDSERVFLLPFQQLRMAFRRNLLLWKQRGYRVATQTTPTRHGKYQSECIFVPASVVIDAIANEMAHEVAA